MATMITSECINCGACEPECPNTAIYQGGVEWEMNGVKHPPLSAEVFYIVPEKCTECVGFHDQEACAAVCPVDVCIPNPDIPESEEVLLQRARELHPGVQFGPEFPSRFRVGGRHCRGACRCRCRTSAGSGARSGRCRGTGHDGIVDRCQPSVDGRVGSADRLPRVPRNLCGRLPPPAHRQRVALPILHRDVHRDDHDARQRQPRVGDVSPPLD